MQCNLLMILSVLLFSSCNNEEGTIEVEPPTQVSENVQMVVSKRIFTVSLYDNATADAFLAMVPMKLNMSDFNDNEKVCSLPRSLTTAASNPGTIHVGDLMLYGSSSLVLFYETFSTSYSYTPIGRVNNVAGLKAALGSGSVMITFERE